MTKIIKLKQDVDFFYEKALEKYDKGDYIGCLDFLNSAKNLSVRPYSDDDLAVRLEIAEIYSEMGLYEESNKEFFLLTVFDYCSDEVFYGIIKNFALSEQPQLAAYYLNFGIEAGILDEDDGFMPIDLSVFKPDTQLRLLKNKDNEYSLMLAKQLLSSGQPDYAREILLSVPSSSPQRPDALNCLALLELSEGNVKEGLDYCDEALSLDKSDIDAVAAKIMGLTLLNRKEEAEEYKKQIDSSMRAEWPEVVKIALCMAETGDNAMTEKYTRKALSIAPYDKNMLLLNALSASNLGNRVRAKDSVVKLSVIYPGDPIVSYYAKQIDMVPEGGKSQFELICDIGVRAKQEYSDLIETTKAKAKTPDVFALQLAEDKELRQAVDWAINFGGTDLAVSVASFLAESKLGAFMVKEFLLYPDFPLSAKKAVFSALLRKGHARVIQIIINNQLYWFRPNIPKITKNKIFTGAYFQVYSALAFIDANFDRRLNIWYKKIVNILEKNRELEFKENVIAAVLAYKSQINKVFSTKNYACEIFGCTYDDFNKIYSYINETSKTKDIKETLIK